MLFIFTLYLPFFLSQFYEDFIFPSSYLSLTYHFICFQLFCRVTNRFLHLPTSSKVGKVKSRRIRFGRHNACKHSCFSSFFSCLFLSCLSLLLLTILYKPKVTSKYITPSSLQISVLSPGAGKNAPAVHWFTATPNPCQSMYKPFIFCDAASVGDKTR